MNVLTTKDRARILSMLVEGSGINATCHMTGVSKIAILKLLSYIE